MQLERPGDLRTKHEMIKRRVPVAKVEIGFGHTKQAGLEIAAICLRRLQRLMKPVKADKGQLAKQNGFIGKMLIGRSVADTGAAGDLSQGEAPISIFDQHRHSSVDYAAPQIAMMIRFPGHNPPFPHRFSPNVDSIYIAPYLTVKLPLPTSGDIMNDPAEILQLQRDTFLQSDAPDLAQRRADLKKLRQAIIANRTRIEAAISADFGHRSSYETALMEIVPTVQGIDYLSRNLRRFMRPERRHVAFTYQPGRAYVAYQPLGVVGIVSPWNYPLSLAIMPLATAIAAGNRVMVKPSEYTPETSDLMATILAEIFRPDQVAVIKGDAEVGAAFTALPFDHLLFTGSTQVGRAVMKAASENLVPVTLELGGKSPAIISLGHATEANVANIAFGKLANAGQTCIAPDYVLLHADDVENFRSAYVNAVSQMYPGGNDSKDYSAIINARHFQRLTGLLADAKAKGADVITLADAPQNAGANKLPPSLLLNVTDEMEVMQQEIFGPILPIVTYRSIDEAIAYINARPRPLALYYFGDNDAARRKVLTRTVSGNVGINNTLMHYAQDDLPFGGVGPSGMGAYHGIEGFRAFSHAKGIYSQHKWNAAKLIRAPFGKLADAALRFMLR